MSWQIGIVQSAAMAAIGFLGGCGTLWLKLREQQKKRQIEYEDFKRMRRLIGGGEVERMERADRLTEIIIKHKTHDITPEDFQRYHDLIRPATKKQGEKSKETLRSEEEIRKRWGELYDHVSWFRVMIMLEMIRRRLREADQEAVDLLTDWGLQIEKRRGKDNLRKAIKTEFDQGKQYGAYEALGWALGMTEDELALNLGGDDEEEKSGR